MSYKKSYLLTTTCLSLLLCGCSSSPHMTLNQYEAIPLGHSIADVQKESGKPYKRSQNTEGMEEYTYIERLRVSRGHNEFRIYTLTVNEGVVVNKAIDNEKNFVPDYIKY